MMTDEAIAAALKAAHHWLAIANDAEGYREGRVAVEAALRRIAAVARVEALREIYVLLDGPHDDLNKCLAIGCGEICTRCHRLSRQSHANMLSEAEAALDAGAVVAP